MADLFSKHIVLSDLKVYLVSSGEKPAVSGDSTNLAGKTPIYRIDGTLSAANDGTATAVDGRTVSFAYQPGGALTETTEQGSQDVYAAGPGFTISANDLPFDSYLASAYSMDIDWQGFYQEALDKGLLDGAGNAMGTDRAPQLTVKNQVAGDRAQKASASAGQVKVESATFGKSVKDVDASAGTATWRLSAKTSDSLDPFKLVFDDESAFSASDEAVATAARSATSIEGIEISLDSAVLYKDGALTDEAKAAGWTDGNVSVSVEGTRLSIAIRDVDGSKVLGKGQRYDVSYRTVLDKNAYVSALVQAGASAKDAAYSIDNAASLSSGGVALPGESSASFRPSVPVTAEKSAAVTPQNGFETQSASFAVKAGTGEAAREGFTLTDQITTMYGYNDSAAAAQKAMMLSALSAKAPTWAASALKLVDGGQGETPAGAFTFSLVQVDESGNPIEGGQSAEAVNGADGAISFDAITYGPRNIAGTYWYQITEKSTDELAAIYKMDESVKTVKVTLQKGADGDYLLSCEVVDGGDGAAADSVVFNNETIPEVPDNPDKPGNPDTPDTPGNPDKPDTPEVSDSPDAPQVPEAPEGPEAPGDENVLSKTGDGAPTASLLALALGGLGVAAIARRLRRQ